MNSAEVYRSTIRFLLSPVEDLLYGDPEVTEVLINGCAKIYCEKHGRLELTGKKFPNEEMLAAAARNLAEYVNRPLDEEHHSMDARLPEPENFRVHIITPPVSRVGICISIRKFPRTDTTLAWLIAKDSIDKAGAEYLSLMVKAHRNLVISGGAGSGKTSLLNALSAVIPANERIVVMEDTSELRLQQEDVVYLETRPANSEGKGAVTIRRLFVDSLRMRPDRILVGEVRGGEAQDLVSSMLSGHDGSLSTIHGSTPLHALIRLEALCLMNEVQMPVYDSRVNLASAVHVIVQVARQSDGSRKVTAITELVGLDDKEKYRLRPIFRRRIIGRDASGAIVSELARTGRRSTFGKLIRESDLHRELKWTKDLFEPRDDTKGRAQ